MNKQKHLYKEEIEELKKKIEELQDEYGGSYVDKLVAIAFLKVLFLLLTIIFLEKLLLKENDSFSKNNYL